MALGAQNLGKERRERERKRPEKTIVSFSFPPASWTGNSNAADIIVAKYRAEQNIGFPDITACLFTTI